MHEQERQEKTKERTTLREKLADTVDFSKEIILDTVLLSMIGDRELTVENYKSILAYTETRIRLKAKPYPIEIIGSDLQIQNIDGDFLHIIGRVYGFSFCRE